MIIKKAEKKHPLKKIKSKLIKRKIVLAASFFVLCIYTGAMLIVGADIHRKEHIGTLKNALFFRVNVVGNYIKGKLSHPEHLSIDIKFLDLKKLEYKRNLALKAGILVANSDDYVPAIILYNGEKYSVKLRLKGDFLDHLQGEKWSFRVKVLDNKTIMGMTKFSLQHPKTRGYIHEWLFHKLLQKEGVLNLNYQFITLQLNGKSLGIYAVEEHFDKHLLERQGMKEGPIVKENEDIMFEMKISLPVKKMNSNGGPPLWYSSISVNDGGFPDVFQTKKNINNPILKKQFLAAYQLLELFRKEKIRVSEAFDIDTLAAHYAISDVLGGQHGSSMHNMRFYYNPILSKLMPIGFDAKPGNIIKNLSALYSDTAYVKAYVSYLEKFSSRDYLDSFLESIEKEFNKNKNILYKEFPMMAVKIKNFYINQALIQNALNPIRPLNIYLQDQQVNNLQLSIGNNQIFPIEILKIVVDGEWQHIPSKPLIINGLKKGEFTAYREYNVNVSNKKIERVDDIQVMYRLLGSKKVHQSSIFPYSRIENNFVRHDFIRQKGNSDQFPFIIKDDVEKKIIIKSGHWVLDKPLIIPENYTLHAYQGLVLTLEKEAMIFSKGPIKFIGSFDKPIRIKNGRGLVVIKAKKQSELRYVHFDNVANPSHQLWDLTGSVTFYESPVTIENCMFSNNHSEDMLNIVRSKFELKNSEFNHSYSDAIDIDFSNGVMKNIKIYQAGNDGIDVSGAQVNLKEIYIKSAGDKGISSGENSEITGKQISIYDSEIALASKDGSYINAESVAVVSANLGFVVFQKKSAYGPGTIRVTNVSEDNLKTRALVEDKSVLFINEQAIKATTKKVKSVLYGKVYGKASKK
ncbi:MAG: CotH kinase family protein [bacterium]